MERLKKIVSVLLCLLLFVGLGGCRKKPVEPDPVITDPVNTGEPLVTDNGIVITEDGVYDTKDEVALYIYSFHHLPDNYMTKREARKQGWSSGPLHFVIDGMCIGGDYFGNNEGLLPEIDDDYYECDIDTLTAKSRGAKRIIYTEYGDVYYTDDHYESFEQLYEGDH